MIELKDISFAYADHTVLEHFNLKAEAGACVCLFGPSGCGKTTVTRLLLGLERPLSGQITVPAKWSCVFQEDRLVPRLNVWDNLRLPLSAEQYPKAAELLAEVGPEGVKQKRITELSGGMRRRLAVIRAIAYGGDALILDEPFNGIDAENKQKLAAIIRREFTAKGKSVVLVSHLTEDAALLNATILHI